MTDPHILDTCSKGAVHNYWEVEIGVREIILRSKVRDVKNLSLQRTGSDKCCDIILGSKSQTQPCMRGAAKYFGF